MSKKDTSYRPTPFALRKADTEPMATRGGSSSNLAEEGDGSAPSPELEMLISDSSISDEVAMSIAKLPASSDELLEADSVDILSVNELTQICKTFSIPVTPVAEGIKGKNRRDRSIQVKSELLALIASRFEDQWKVLHDEMRKRKAPTKRGPRRSEGRTSTASVSSYQTAMNDALMRVMREETMPSREDLVFLNDEEYNAALHFFKATHVDRVSNTGRSGTEMCALQYLYGITKETTAALEACLSSACAANAFIDRIVQAMENKESVPIEAPDAESSEDPAE